MFGFSAFSEAPLSSEKRELEQTNDFAGVAGAGVLGELAIGETGNVTGVNLDLDTDAQANAGLVDIPTIVTRPLASVLLGAQGEASIPAVAVAEPEATLSAEAVVSIDLHKATRTFAVTVVNDGYGNKYYIDGVKQASLSLHEVGIYRFDVSDSSISGHPFAFSTTSDGTHGGGTQYTTNVTVVGTSGNAGAYVEIEVTESTPDLYYYCQIHSGMGSSITFVTDFSQVPFIIEIASVAAEASGGAIAEATAAQVSLNAAEATASGAAEATFADLLDVGVSAPQASVSISVTASSSLPATSVTSPDPSVSGSATANTSVGSVSIITPTPAISGIEVPDAMPRIDVAAPQGSARVDITTNVSDTLSITVTAPEIDVRIRTLDNYEGRVDRFTTKHNFGATRVNLSFPTTFTLSSGGFAGTYTVNSYTTMNKRLIDWDSQRAIVWFDGQNSTLGGSSSSWMATWEFDLSGNLTIIDVEPFLPGKRFGLAADYVDGIRGSSFIDGDLESHPAASGDVQMITPLLSFMPSGTYAGTYAYVNIRAISWNDPISHDDTDGLAYSNWAPLKVSNRTDYSNVAILLINVTNSVTNWPEASTVLPWRGDWGSRPRQNYLVWPLNISGEYYLYLAAENGDLITVYSDTSVNPNIHLFRIEANKFANGTYPNYCVGDSTDDFIWFHDDSTEYRDRAERYLSVSEDIQTFDTDMEVDITDSSLQVAELLTSIITPEGIARISVTASASINEVDVVAAESLASQSNVGEASLNPINVTSPDPSVGADASGNVGTSQVSSPEATASGSAQIDALLGEVSASNPDALAKGDANQEVSIGTVSVSAPRQEYSDLALPTVGIVTVSAPEASVDGNASANLVTVDILPADISGFDGDASGDLPDISIITPTPAISGIEVPDAMPRIDVSAPASIAQGNAKISVPFAMIVAVIEPDGLAEGEFVTLANASLAEINVVVPLANASADFEASDQGLDPVIISAPEASVSNQGSADVGEVAITSPIAETAVVAQASTPLISQTAPNATVKASSTAEDSPLGGVDVFSPEPTTTAQSDVADLQEVSIVIPEGSAEGKIGGQVSDVPQIDVIAAEGSGRQSGQTGEGSLDIVDVFAPEPEISITSEGSVIIPQVDVTAPEASVSITTYTGLVASTTVTLLTIEAEASVDNTAEAQSFIVIDISVIASATGTALITIDDLAEVNVASVEAVVSGNANLTVTDDLLIDVVSINGQAFSQDVITTLGTPFSRVYDNQTTISWGSDANLNFPSVEEGVIVLTPYGVTPRGGTPFKPLCFATNRSASGDARFVLQVREFTSETETSLITEYHAPSRSVQPLGYSSTLNTAYRATSALYLDNTTRYTDSDGVEWPSIIFGYQAETRYTGGNEYGTTTKYAYKWIEIRYNPVSESIVSSTEKYDIGQGIGISAGTYRGGMRGGHARTGGENLTFEFLYLDSFPGPNSYRQYRAEHHQIEVSTGTERRNLTEQTVTTSLSTFTSARTSMLDTIEGRDTDATHIEGIAEDAFTYTVQDESKDVSTTVGTVSVSNAAPSVSAGLVVGAGIPQVSIVSIEGKGAQDRLVEIELPITGVGAPQAEGQTSQTAEPDGPGVVDVIPPEGAVSQLTTVQEISDIINISAVAPEATIAADFIFGINGPATINYDAPQPLVEVATSSLILNVSVIAPEGDVDISSQAESALPEISAINPEVTVQQGSTASVDLADVQIVIVSSPEPITSVEAIVADPLTVQVGELSTSITVDSTANPTGVNVLIRKPEAVAIVQGNGLAGASINAIDVLAPRPQLSISSLVEVTTINGSPVSVVAPEGDGEIIAPALLPEVGITAPSAFIENDFEAQVTINEISITVPAVFIQASARIEATTADVEVINPEGTGGGGGGAGVSQVSVIAPAPQVTVDGNAREVLLSAQPVSVQSPTAITEVVAISGITEVSVVAPISDILALAESSIPEISVIAPEPEVTTIDDFTQAFSSLVEVTVSTPLGLAEGSGSVASIPEITITAPQPTAVVEEFPTNIPTVTIEAPEGRAFTSTAERTLRVDAETRVLVIEFEDRRIVVER